MFRASVASLAIGALLACYPSDRPCSNDTQCTADQVCVNQRCADRSTGASGGGGGGTASNVGGGGGGANSPSCLSNPEEAAVRSLSVRPISRDACEAPTQAEAQTCSVDDARLIGNIQTTGDWNCLMAWLATQAGIATNVDIRVATDLLATPIPAGGGVTGGNVVFVDGKFLEILSEYANYLALAEAGQATEDAFSAVNRIVSAHNSVHGARADPLFYPTGILPVELTGSAFLHLQAMAGAILYHEYGHYWAWGCVDRLRLGLASSVGFYVYPPKIEDDADLISGILSAKTAHDEFDSMMTIDLMAFYTMQRAGLAIDFRMIAFDYDQQFRQMNQAYESLAIRKQLISRGFADYRSLFTAGLPPTLPNCNLP